MIEDVYKGHHMTGCRLYKSVKTQVENSAIVTFPTVETSRDWGQREEINSR